MAELNFTRARPHARIDAINYFILCSCASRHWGPRDRLIETIVVV